MEIHIEGRHKNALLHREELDFEILDAKQTPPRAEVKKALAAKMGVDGELVIIEQLVHGFGDKTVRGFAKKYDTIDVLREMEQKHMMKRNGVSEKPVEETPAAESPAEEAPAAESSSEENTEEPVAKEE